MVEQKRRSSAGGAGGTKAAGGSYSQAGAAQHAKKPGNHSRGPSLAGSEQAQDRASVHASLEDLPVNTADDAAMAQLEAQLVEDLKELDARRTDMLPMDKSIFGENPPHEEAEASGASHPHHANEPSEQAAAARQSTDRGAGLSEVSNNRSSSEAAISYQGQGVSGYSDYNLRSGLDHTPDPGFHGDYGRGNGEREEAQSLVHQITPDAERSMSSVASQDLDEINLGNDQKGNLGSQLGILAMQGSFGSDRRLDSQGPGPQVSKDLDQINLNTTALDLESESAIRVVNADLASILGLNSGGLGMSIQDRLFQDPGCDSPNGVSQGFMESDGPFIQIMDRELASQLFSHPHDLLGASSGESRDQAQRSLTGETDNGNLQDLLKEIGIDGLYGQQPDPGPSGFDPDQQALLDLIAGSSGTDQNPESLALGLADAGYGYEFSSNLANWKSNGAGAADLSDPDQGLGYLPPRSMESDDPANAQDHAYQDPADDKWRERIAPVSREGKARYGIPLASDRPGVDQRERDLASGQSDRGMYERADGRVTKMPGKTPPTSDLNLTLFMSRPTSTLEETFPPPPPPAAAANRHSPNGALQAVSEYYPSTSYDGTTARAELNERSQIGILSPSNINLPSTSYDGTSAAERLSQNGVIGGLHRDPLPLVDYRHSNNGAAAGPSSRDPPPYRSNDGRGAGHEHSQMSHQGGAAAGAATRDAPPYRSNDGHAAGQEHAQMSNLNGSAAEALSRGPPPYNSNDGRGRSIDGAEDLSSMIAAYFQRKEAANTTSASDPEGDGGASSSALDAFKRQEEERSRKIQSQLKMLQDESRKLQEKSQALHVRAAEMQRSGMDHRAPVMPVAPMPSNALSQAGSRATAAAMSTPPTDAGASPALNWNLPARPQPGNLSPQKARPPMSTPTPPPSLPLPSRERQKDGGTGVTPSWHASKENRNNVAPYSHTPPLQSKIPYPSPNGGAYQTTLEQVNTGYTGIAPAQRLSDPGLHRLPHPPPASSQPRSLSPLRAPPLVAEQSSATAAASTAAAGSQSALHAKAPQPAKPPQPSKLAFKPHAQAPAVAPNSKPNCKLPPVKQPPAAAVNVADIPQAPTSAVNPGFPYGWPGGAPITMPPFGLYGAYPQGLQSVPEAGHAGKGGAGKAKAKSAAIPLAPPPMQAFGGFSPFPYPMSLWPPNMAPQQQQQQQQQLQQQQFQAMAANGALGSMWPMPGMMPPLGFPTPISNAQQSQEQAQLQQQKPVASKQKHTQQQQPKQPTAQRDHAEQRQQKRAQKPGISQGLQAADADVTGSVPQLAQPSPPFMPMPPFFPTAGGPSPLYAPFSMHPPYPMPGMMAAMPGYPTNNLAPARAGVASAVSGQKPVPSAAKALPTGQAAAKKNHSAPAGLGPSHGLEAMDMGMGGYGLGGMGGMPWGMPPYPMPNAWAQDPNGPNQSMVERAKAVEAAQHDHYAEVEAAVVDRIAQRQKAGAGGGRGVPKLPQGQGGQRPAFRTYGF